MTKLADLLAEARGSITYRAERAVLDFTGDIDRLVEERDMTRAELAERIGTSAAYVSKVLRGETNLTVKTMVSLADASEADIRISIVDRRSEHLTVEGFKRLLKGFKAGREVF